MPLRPEDRLQSRCRAYLDAALPAPGWWCSIITERKQSPAAGQRAKARGQRRGVSDIMIWYLGRFIGAELKIGKNDTSDAQDGFGAAMFANGFHYAVVRSVEVLDALLREQGVPVPPSMRIAALDHDAKLALPQASPTRKRKPGARPQKATAAAERMGRSRYGL